MNLQSWQFFSILSAFFAALTTIFGKLGVSEINSNLATLIRVLVILIFNFCLVYFRNEWQGLSNISGRSLVFLVASGLATGASWLFFYRALQLGQASQVAPVDKLSVVGVLILSFLFLGEVPSLKVIAGSALILAGSLVIIL